MSLPDWLIERNQLHGEPSARWFSERKRFAQVEQDIWVQDVARAERFISKESAEQSIQARFVGDDRYPILPVATDHIDVEVDLLVENERLESALTAANERIKCTLQICDDLVDHLNSANERIRELEDDKRLAWDSWGSAEAALKLAQTALTAEREVSDKLEKALRAMVSGDPDAWNESRAALAEVHAE